MRMISLIALTLSIMGCAVTSARWQEAELLCAAHGGAEAALARQRIYQCKSGVTIGAAK
jgi:hypothetical protein